MQLIHWFTNNKKFESQDTVAVLEAIMVGVLLSTRAPPGASTFIWFRSQGGLVDPVDSTLRDFSGRCIQEFVKWSIKQTTPKQQERSPTNMKSLFKRIYSLALHPNGFKRLGAALAFNSVYRLFRWARLLSPVRTILMVWTERDPSGTVFTSGIVVNRSSNRMCDGSIPWCC